MFHKKMLKVLIGSSCLLGVVACSNDESVTEKKSTAVKPTSLQTADDLSLGRAMMTGTTGATVSSATLTSPAVVVMPVGGLPVSGLPAAGTTPVISPAPVISPVPVANPAPVSGPTPSPTPVSQVLPDFKYLPIIQDMDGNPNDNVSTYNLTVDENVPVNVVTPSGSWTTPMMRYNNSQLPPVIVARRGAKLTFNVQNKLPEETTIHWHGFKIPAIQDGGPDTPIGIGVSHQYRFDLIQPAASLWFHPHPHGFTAEQVYKGLAGALIITDDITDNLEASKQLPAGKFDVALLVQDRSFAADDGTGTRSLLYQPNMMMGMLGDTVLINGVQMPALKVETRQYRLRLFNGSNARTYDFALSNNATFKIVGTDGGLLPQPIGVNHVTLSAGERAEVIVDFGAYTVGENIALINRSSPVGSTTHELMRFDITTLVTDDVVLYSSLPMNAEIYDRLTADQAVVNRNFVMSMGGMAAGGGMNFLINGKSFDINRVDELVTAGTTEIWTISNTSMMAHPFHAHAIQWQVLDRNNLPPTGTDLGWKDTVLVQPGETVRFIGKFDPVVNIGRYMYHCHILEHEGAGMMGIFEIR